VVDVAVFQCPDVLAEFCGVTVFSVAERCGVNTMQKLANRVFDPVFSRIQHSLKLGIKQCGQIYLQQRGST